MSLIAVTLGRQPPLTARRLLWINVVSDIFPVLALAVQPPEPDILGRPPRDPREPLLRRRDLRRLGLQAATMTAGSLGVYGRSLARHGAGPRTDTTTFMSVTLAQLFHLLSARSERHSLFGSSRVPGDRTLVACFGASGVLQVLSAAWPPLRRVLGNARMGPGDWLAAVAGSGGAFLANELLKPDSPLVRLARRNDSS